MKTVLVVDDDQIILSTLVNYLSSVSEDFRLLTATDGRQALGILEQEPIDLLLTDLYMPGMDGFELLAHMVRRFASVPVIVMSGYQVPEMGNNAGLKGALHYIEKPFHFETLAETVSQTLARTSKGHLTGISLLGFLQLLNFEKKSCVLTVTSGGRTGRIHVTDGELANAEHERLQGESAIFEILAWEDCEIDVDVARPVERLIHRPLHGVILEAAKDQDENRAPSGSRSSDVATAPIAIDEGPLSGAALHELGELLGHSSLKQAGVIGLALIDIQQSEVVSYRCHQYWPDFNERGLAGVASFRRRLELDDGEQLDEVLITLEALIELWLPMGRDRRMAFYLLMNRASCDLALARSALVELGPRVRELLAAPSATAEPA